MDQKGRRLGTFAVALATITAAFAGCLSDEEASDGSGPDGPVEGTVLQVPAVEMGHDHRDAALHGEIADGFTVLSSITFVEGDYPQPGVLELGNAGRMVLRDTTLFIATVRDSRSGFSVVDVSEPALPRLLGSYRSDLGTSEGEALAVTMDGAYAFVSIETSFNSPPLPPAIEIVDVSDPTAPVLAARIPTSAQPHVLQTFEADGAQYLVASEYQVTIFGAASLPLPAASATSAGVTIYRLDTALPNLVPVSHIVFSPSEIEEGFYFAHDPIVIEHPATGSRLLYLGAFGGGGRIYSIDDPASPMEVGSTRDKGASPVLRWHSFSPAPVMVDGVLATAAVPRTGSGDGPGSAYLTVYDTAMPDGPVLVGQWVHPDPDLIPGDDPHLNLHVPEFAKGSTRLLVPHFHAGLFAFDVSSREKMEALEPVAYFRPGPGSPAEGAPEVSAIATAIEAGDVVLAADTIGGVLYALRLER